MFFGFKFTERGGTNPKSDALDLEVRFGDHQLNSIREEGLDG